MSRSAYRLVGLSAAIGLVAVTVVVANLTGTRVSILQTRSGFACENAVPPCPQLPTSIDAFQPNWANGLGVAVLVAIVLVVGASLLARRLNRHHTDLGDLGRH